MLCQRDQGCANRDQDQAGMGIPAGCQCWDASQGLVLGSQLQAHVGSWSGSGFGSLARVWCWKSSQGLVLDVQLGSSTGIPDRIWCWKPSWVLALESQLQ